MGDSFGQNLMTLRIKSYPSAWHSCLSRIWALGSCSVLFGVPTHEVGVTWGPSLCPTFSHLCLQTRPGSCLGIVPGQTGPGSDSPLCSQRSKLQGPETNSGRFGRERGVSYRRIAGSLAGRRLGPFARTCGQTPLRMTRARDSQFPPQTSGQRQGCPGWRIRGRVAPGSSVLCSAGIPGGHKVDGKSCPDAEEPPVNGVRGSHSLGEGGFPVCPEPLTPHSHWPEGITCLCTGQSLAGIWANQMACLHRQDGTMVLPRWKQA